MKAVLELARDKTRKPGLDNPIKIEGLACYQNGKGYWCLKFSTPNHKYLELSAEVSTSRLNETWCEHGSAQGFELDTYESWFADRKGNEVGLTTYGRKRRNAVELPEDSVSIYLVPESKEEAAQLRGKFVLLPEKHSYRACLVPFEDFYEPTTV